MTEFDVEVVERIKDLATNSAIQSAAQTFMMQSQAPKYSYNFRSLGRPIIQYPQDMIAWQELIWKIQPDLIIETGIAHGGSLIQSASMLSLLDMCDAINDGVSFDPAASLRKVVGIDIDIRTHNRDAIESHPMFSRIELIEGSSVDPLVVSKVSNLASSHKTVLVSLDSNHTHDHVLQELRAYANLTSLGSYCVVFDTIIEDLHPDSFPDRPWGKGDNPKTAVREFLRSNTDFEIDRNIQNKLLITVAPDGYLKRVK